MAVLASGLCSERRVPDRLEPDEFAREIRRLAIDAWRGLTRTDTSVDELTSLKCRFEDLLRQRQGARVAEINRWLRNGKRAIDARLHLNPKEGLRVRLPHSKRLIRTSNVRPDPSIPRPVGPHTDLKQPKAVPLSSAGTYGRRSRVRGRSRVQNG